MKNRILAAWATLAIAICAGVPAAAQSTDGAVPPATLTVTGEASVTHAPNRATVSFRIDTTDDRSDAATSANSAIVNALTKRLEALGVPASAIVTTGYALNYTPRPPKPDPESTQRFGYTVDRTIDVAVDAVDSAGAAIDAGVAAGVTSVDGVRFSLRDDRGALREAQAAALDDAAAQARGLAAAAGVRIVRILSIAPGGSGPVPTGRARVMALAAVPTTIDPGSLTVPASVTVRYEIASASSSDETAGARRG